MIDIGEQKALRSRKIKLLQYSLIVFLFWIALYIYVPTLPVFFESVLHDLVKVGTVLSMYGLGQAFLRLPVGIIADWRGWHRQLIFITILFVGGGALLMSNGQTMSVLTLGRLTTGFGAAGWVLLMVAFSSLFEPKEAVKAVAILTFINTFGRFLATLVTGFLNNLGGYPLPFIMAAVLAAVAILLFIPNSGNKSKAAPVSMANIGRLIVRSEVYLPAVINLFVHIVEFGATFSFLPLLAESFGATNVQLSFLTSMSMALTALVSLSVSWLDKYISTTRLIYIALILGATGLVIAAVAGSLGLVFIAQALLGISMGLNYPCLVGLSILYVNETERSTAMGLHQSIYSIGMFVGPWLGGLLSVHFGIQSMFLFIAVLCAGAGIAINYVYQTVIHRKNLV